MYRVLEIEDHECLMGGGNYLAIIDDNRFLVSTISESQFVIVNEQTSDAATQNYYSFIVDGISDFELANVIFESNMSYFNSNSTLFILYKYYPNSMIVNLNEGTVIFSSG